MESLNEYKYVLYVYPDWAIENSLVKAAHQKQRIEFRYRSLPSQAAGNIFVLHEREESNVEPIFTTIVRVETHAYPHKRSVTDVTIITSLSHDDFKFLERNLKHYR